MARRPLLFFLAFLALSGGAAATAFQGEDSSSPTPSLRFLAGPDYDDALRHGFVTGEFQSIQGGRAYGMELVGLSGGSVIIDGLVEVRAGSDVAAYALEVAEEWQGALQPEELRVRLWQGSDPPNSDADVGVCAVLDSLAGQGTETLGQCRGSAWLQIRLSLPTGAAGTGSMGLRPTRVAHD